MKSPPAGRRGRRHKIRAAIGVLVHTLKPGDVAIIGIAAIAVTVLTVGLYAAPSTAIFVRIEANSTTFLYPLDQPRTVQPLAEDGTCVITIDEAGVRVVTSDCPQQICMSMGTITVPGQWIACLPHQVFVSIDGSTSDTGVDATAF